MRPKAIYFWFAAAFLWITTIPCFSNPWLFRPGLWKQTTITDGIIVHIPPGTSPELSARLRAMALPHAYTDERCLQRGQALFGNPIDPITEKIFECTEKTVYKGDDAELIQDECFLRPDPPPGLERLPRYLKTVRYVGRTAEAKGMVWGVDNVIKSSKTGPDSKTVMRWIGGKCGDARSSGNPH
jgi:hypothetical protein